MHTTEAGPGPTPQERSAIERIERLFSRLGSRLGAPAAQAGGPADTVASWLERVDAQAEKRGLPPLSRAQLALLGLTGLYHTRGVLESFAHYLSSGREAFLKRLLESEEYRASLDSPAEIRFKELPPGAVLFDVTHTLDYPYNSGIQRVVRQAARCFDIPGSPVVFFRVDPLSAQPVLLNEAEKAKLSRFGEKSLALSGTSKLGWAARDLLVETPRRLAGYLSQDARYFAHQVYHRFRDEYLVHWATHFRLARALFNWIDRHKAGVKKDLAARQESARRRRAIGGRKLIETPLLIDVVFLLAEVPIEHGRIEFYLAARPSLPVRLNLVIYDLIPLVVPEYCVLDEMFIHYTRIFRVADKAICISEAVAEDMRNFSKILIREAPLATEALHLAGDFKPEETPAPAGASPAGTPGRPRILCVGTFEPRKNQVNVLRAAHGLRAKGLDFELAFAGNPGWKNEVFTAEIEKLDPQGRFARIYSRVSDAELEALYRSSDFSVFCSHAEGFGLPILESLMRGKPVVASDRGSMAEIARLYGGCVGVDPDDVSSIARAMEELLTRPDRLKELAGQIRRERGRSWQQYSAELLSKCLK